MVPVIHHDSWNLHFADSILLFIQYWIELLKIKTFKYLLIIHYIRYELKLQLQLQLQLIIKLINAPDNFGIDIN